MYSLTACFLLRPRSFPITDQWTVKLGDVNDGGGGPIWPQSDGPVVVDVTTTLILLIALALLLPLVLSMPSSSAAKPPFNKTAESPENELPFPGKLVEGKYDVQYLHL